MTGSNVLINNLAGLLVITSLLVVFAKKPISSVKLYAVQSLVLALTFVAIAYTMQAPELFLWAGSAVITKVVLVPTIIFFAFKQLADPSSSTSESVFHPAIIVVIAAAIVLISYFAVANVHIPIIDQYQLKPVLAVSLGHFLIGLLCIVTQRNILKQVFGYCIMENGAHLTLALMANKAPKLVEIGIATDAIFAVVVMTYLVRRIYSSIHTLDARELTSLKG